MVNTIHDPLEHTTWETMKTIKTFSPSLIWFIFVLLQINLLRFCQMFDTLARCEMMQGATFPQMPLKYGGHKPISILSVEVCQVQRVPSPYQTGLIKALAHNKAVPGT